MSHRTYLPSFVMLGALCGCASGATAPPNAMPAASPRDEGARAAEPIVAAQGPVEKPADLSLSLRLAAPARDLPIVSLLVPMNADVKTMLGKPGTSLGIILGPALARIVDLTRPVDIVGASAAKGEKEGQRGAAGFDLAAGVSPGAALKGSFALRHSSSGSLALDPRGDRTVVGMVGSKIACELWPAPARDQRGRLVCATDSDMLPAYGPYLARGMAASSTAAGMRLELTNALLHKLLPAAESASSSGKDAAEQANDELAKKIMLDFVNDLETTAVEVTFKPGPVELAYEQTFQSSRSTATVVTCANPASPTAAPPALFRMPADADMALYLQGAPKEVMKTRGPAAIRHLLESTPETELPRSAHDEVVAAFSAVLLTGGPLVVARGHDRQGAWAALDQYAATKRPPGNTKLTTDVGLQKARRSLQGWTLVHVNEPTEAWGKGMREMLRVGNKDYPAEAPKPSSAGSGGPKTPAPPNKPSRSVTKIREQRVSPSDKLPAGSLHFVVTVRANPKYVQEKSTDKDLQIPHEVHVWLTPEGGATWIALGEDSELAREKLRQVLAGSATAPAPAPLGLEALRGAQGAGIGAVTLAGLVSLFLPDESRTEMDEAQKRLAILDALPAKGTSAIPVVWTSEPRAGQDGSPACRVRLSTILDKDALGNLVAWGRGRDASGAP